MKIVKLKGGLGNQMFQYAFAKYLEKTDSDIVKLDLSQYSGLKTDSIRKPRILKFNISLSVATKKEINNVLLFHNNFKPMSFSYFNVIRFENFFNSKYYLQKNHENVTQKIQKKQFFDGYWQSYEIIQNVFKDLKKDFVPSKESLSKITLQKIKEFDSSNNSFVGIRKGDYSNNQKAIKKYGFLSNKYFIDGMNLIEKESPGSNFIIFSNDIEWVKKNMNFSTHKVQYFHESPEQDDFEILQIMTHCKNAIISNSTFHWWGAYLIENPKKIIISPSPWVPDNRTPNIVPPCWKKISNPFINDNN